MSRKEKLLEKICNNPKDVRFDDLCKILDWSGWSITAQTSSHFTYSKPRVGRVTIVKKSDGKVKPIYVKMVLNLMGASNE